MKIKQYFIHGILIFLLGMMAFLGHKAYNQAILYEALTTEMVGYQGAEEQAKLQLERLAKSVLGDFYTDEKKIHLDKMKSKKDKARQEAKKYTLYFMFCLGLIVLSFFVISSRMFILFGAIGAMETLFLGLISPILMITIHKDIEYLGDIVLSFESKGVIGSIVKLVEEGDLLVAMVILIFSVLVPIAKVSSLLFASVFMQSSFAHDIVKFFKVLGKWSMVDVFVVAVFLVYLTANKGDISRAEVEVGLYFFLAYVLISMLLSLSADKMLQKLKA